MFEPKDRQSLRTPEGVTITYYTLGTGPGLVIVHGSMRQATDYYELAKNLSTSFTVHVMNRRGRDGSDPQGQNFSLEQERGDVIALLRHTNSKLLFGHSFGGLVALEAALVHPLQKLAVYEPALSIDNSIDDAWVASYEQALAKNDEAAAQKIFLKGMAGATMPDEQLDTLAQAIMHSPMWAVMQPLLPTIPAEVHAAHAANNAYGKYHAITTETLLMTGTTGDNIASGRLARRATAIDALEKTIPGASVIEFEGLGHNAPEMDAPDKIAQALVEFFTA